MSSAILLFFFNLKLLTESDHVFVNGTFSYAPKLFLQIHTVQYRFGKNKNKEIMKRN